MGDDLPPSFRACLHALVDEIADADDVGLVCETIVALCPIYARAQPIAAALMARRSAQAAAEKSKGGA